MPEQTDIYEDLNEVSIPLLQGFLRNLIDIKNRVRDVKRTTPNSYAMKAYGHATETPADVTVAEDVSVMGFTRLDLAAEGLDRAEVELLLTQLEKLEHAGITHLSIQRSSGFLQSIREAIARV